MFVLRLSIGGVSFRHCSCVARYGPGIRVVTETNQKKQVPLMEGMPLAGSSECKDFFLVLYSQVKEIPNYPKTLKAIKNSKSISSLATSSFLCFKKSIITRTFICSFGVQGYSSFHGLLRNHEAVARNKFNSYILKAYEL